ncbi:glycosyltransferase [Vibrio campbellii]
MNDKCVSVVVEHRFYSYKNKVYTKLSFPYLYWQDYLKYFKSVKVIARVKQVDSIDSTFVRVDGEGVTVFPMPYYVGMFGFIRSLPRILKFANNYVGKGNKFILRSGNVSNVIWLFVMFRKCLYLREYPGNIKEGIIGYSGRGFLNVVLANFLHLFAKFQGKYSKANSFVSSYCEEIYSSNVPSYVFSSFNSDEIKFKKRSFHRTDKVELISVGRLEGEKGHADLIVSLSEIKLDIPLELTLIGDGTKLSTLKLLSEQYGVKVNFTGAISNRERLFKHLEQADLFVIPSHTEGMPRALLEAMAIGLPCIGSSVGGIPEVLDDQMLFYPNNPDSCRKKILELINDRNSAELQSRRNVNFIHDNYSKESLDDKKINFWSELYS